MPPEIKPDAHSIIDHLQELKTETWFRPAQDWWPNCLFHFTNILNAAAILEGDFLYSRRALNELGLSFNDAASPDVINITPEHWKSYVRLYFGPRTPTLFSNEGIRPEELRVHGGAHCAIPVYFIFSATSVLSLMETMFSRGNIASCTSADVGNDFSFFQTIPFHYVYHRDYLTSEDPKQAIIFHRHAEVLVPQKLSLNHAVRIVCRSQAELETLVSLLSPQAFNKWSSKMGPPSKLNLFYGRWTFIQKVVLLPNKLYVTFNAGSETPGPFIVRLELENLQTNIITTDTFENILANRNFEFPVNNSAINPIGYKIKIFLNECFAYQNIFKPNESTIF